MLPICPSPRALARQRRADILVETSRNQDREETYRMRRVELLALAGSKEPLLAEAVGGEWALEISSGETVVVRVEFSRVLAR